MKDRYQIFTSLIIKISRDIRRIKTEEMLQFGLSNTHVSCLYYLYKEKALSAKELTEICLEDKAALSRAIAYLVKNNYIECESLLKKRYNSSLKLTDKGLEIAKQIAVKIDKILDYVGDGISENERKNMYDSLVVVSNNLDRYCGKYKEEK
jgi:DNA-binding MarR family transcriptional regulator